MTESNEHQDPEFTAHIDISLAAPNKRPCVYKLIHRPKPTQSELPTLSLDQDSYFVGRSSDIDITLESSELSRKHAHLERRNGTFSIQDLDSTNGVYLNGTKIYSAQLYHSDIIQLGDLVYEFCEWG